MLLRISRCTPSPAAVISLLALFVALGGTAYAATGGTFILGQKNSANVVTTLKSTSSSAVTLSVINTGGKPAAKFTANDGVAPFQVTSGAMVPNLNADMLDGLSATDMMIGTGRVSSAAQALAPGG
ncbi:MAG: hypothetical protein ABIP53_12300, partial [Candidatus Limnocylindrales bacterium]